MITSEASRRETFSKGSRLRFDDFIIGADVWGSLCEFRERALPCQLKGKHKAKLKHPPSAFFALSLS